MFRVRHLKLVYALVGAGWMGYWDWRLLSAPAAERNPNPAGLVYCMLLFAAIPAIGYLLLFKFLPWTTRLARRAA